MSPWISPRSALILLVLCSAAAGSMMSSLMENNMVMALALARLPPNERSVVGRDQFRGCTVGRLEVGKYMNVWKAKNQFKVCAKCPTPMGFFEKVQKKEGPKLFSSRTAIMKQAFRRALRERLTQHIKNMIG